MDFRKPTLKDKDLFLKYLKQDKRMGCEYAFTNILLWSEKYDVTFCEYEDMLFLGSCIDTDDMAFAYPFAKDTKKAINILKDYCKKQNRPLYLYGISEEMKSELEENFKDEFEFEEKRNSFDYIYNSTDLIELKGKKYHSKRNHINKFMEKEWSYEKITKDNIEDCLKMNEIWCIENDVANDKSKQDEQEVVKNSFKYFEELGLVGGIIRQEGKVVAFSFGEEINDELFVVHVEKAFASVQGAYPIINQQLVKNEASQYKYINREEDLGIEGLRKAKLSYKPAILLTKYEAVLKG